ncbi:MAG TPA: histidine kinase [Ignavibacteriaceae bacterium]|nr:histidine kinase [Ignavibacteriaceae bacterium]
MVGHPLINSPKNFLLYLLFWVLIVILYLNLIVLDREVELSKAILDIIVFNVLLLGLGIGFWFSAKYLSIENHKIFRIISNHLLEGAILISLWLLIGYFIVSNLVTDKDAYTNFFFATLKFRAALGIFTYFLLTSFYYIIIYYTGFQERRIKETELKNLVTEAELRSLKFQINPHFIFNSLNSMSALTEIDPKKAKQMIIKLAEFLRYTLATNDKQMVSLNEELKNIKLYLDIEKIRFEEKFEYVDEIDEICGKAQIPSMILQPLFENAIKHAVYETLDKVVLNLTCTKQDSFLKIVLQNNFESESHKKGAGVGINNIKERLRLIYQQDNLLEVKKENNLFRVTLYIPVDEK